MKPVLIDFSFDLLPELTTPEEALRTHAAGFGYAKYLWKKFRVIIIEQIKNEGDIDRDHVRYHFFNTKGSIARFFNNYRHFIKRNRPDIILIQGLIFPLEIILLRFISDKHIVFIAQHHGEEPGKGIKKILQKAADLCINAYLFTSLDNAQSWVNKRIIKGYHKCFEVLEGSTSFEKQDRDQSRARLNMQGHHNFLWVGRLNANKDPLTVLAAFEDYLNICAEAKLFMIFQEETLLPELKFILASNEALSQAVSFIGKIAHEELPFWYSAADFYISGSHREGSGFALLEAMACGCIPVVTNIPSFRKITDNGKYGFLYEPGNAHALSATLQTLNKINRKKVSEDIIQYFVETLSFKSIADRLSSVCEKLISK